MKKTWFQSIAVVITALSLVYLAGCNTSSSITASGLDKELNFFNWSEYIPDSVIKDFEKKFGVKVNYTTFSSNEEMLAKVSAGGGIYDLTMASNYIIDPMIKQDMIQPIDLAKIPNFSNLAKEYINQNWDPANKYSVPFMGNTQSLAYNPDKITTPINSYADLWKPELKGQIVLLDDERFVLGMVLKTLGYSANDTDPAHLEEAKQKFKQLMPNIKAFDSDSPKTLMINGEVNVMLSWGPEIALAQREKPQVKTILPKEGLMISFDYFVIPKGAKHKKTAEAFINYILDPQVIAEISKKFPYINPNIEGKKLLDKAVLENIAIYPPADEMKRIEWIKDVGDVLKVYDRAWTEAKS